MTCRQGVSLSKLDPELSVCNFWDTYPIFNEYFHKITTFSEYLPVFKANFIKSTTFLGYLTVFNTNIFGVPFKANFLKTSTTNLIYNRIYNL